MFEFIRENVLLVLTLLGAVISFLASFVGLVSKKKPVLVLAVLAVLGFAIGLAYQVNNYNLEQEGARRQAAKAQIDEAAQRARDNVVNEINLTVQQTKITVDSIARQLSETTLQEVATELVSVRSSGVIDFEETAAFAKGSAEMWETFSRWLTGLDRGTAAASLSLRLNADHHYDSGLLLAYLLTSKATAGKLSEIITRPGSWHGFAAEELYLQAYAPETAHLEWVLLYDAASPHPVAFAEAQTFTQALLVYHRLGQHREINALLNHRGANAVEGVQLAFPSLRADVFDTDSAAELVRLMLEQQMSVSVTTKADTPYVARLVRMIRLAARADTQ